MRKGFRSSTRTLKRSSPGIRTGPLGKKLASETPLSQYVSKNPPFFVIFLVVFAIMVLVGASLLCLPQARAPGQPPTAFHDALFTAASGVSCTGLVVLDTSVHWSFFGQAVILALVQLGGLAFMLTSAFLLIVLGKRVGLLDFRFSDAMDASSRPACIKFALQTIALIILFEGLGFLLLYNRFSTLLPAENSLWNAVFHSISAFNNAGFSILSGHNAEVFFHDDFMLLTLSALIILGGISAPVLINVLANGRWGSLNINSKIALSFTLGLLIVGTVGILAMEYGNSLGPLSVTQKIMHSFFYSASSRTAGFSSLNLGVFGFHSLVLVMILMFIGGVAGSTTGGIKVNSFAILLLTMRSYIMGYSHVHAFGKQIPEERVHEAITVFALSIMVICFPVLILAFTENLPKLDLLFESTSAFGTVGLSTGITSSLTVAGRLVIAAAMFIGKLAPLTIVLAISERRRSKEVFQPEEKVRVA